MDDLEPVYPSAVLGYRVWSVTTNNRLYSYGLGNTVWLPGNNYAICHYADQYNHRADQVPAQGCHCGFHAWHTLSRSYRFQRSTYLLDKLLPGGDDMPVLEINGSIIGRGYTQVHRAGVRVQQARVLALLMPDFSKQHEAYSRYNYDPRDSVRQIAHDYRVPLFNTAEELVAYSERFASAAPVAARPKHPLKQINRNQLAAAGGALGVAGAAALMRYRSKR